MGILNCDVKKTNNFTACDLEVFRNRPKILKRHWKTSANYLRSTPFGDSAANLAAAETLF